MNGLLKKPLGWPVRYDLSIACTEMTTNGIEKMFTIIDRLSYRAVRSTWRSLRRHRRRSQ